MEVADAVVEVADVAVDLVGVAVELAGVVAEPVDVAVELAFVAGVLEIYLVVLEEVDPRGSHCREEETLWLLLSEHLQFRCKVPRNGEFQLP